MVSIFRDHAPFYWAERYSIISIEPGSKKPSSSIAKWSGYNNNLPSEETRREWLARYGSHGIGLLLGMEVEPGWRIAAVDVDDDRLVKVTQVILGETPCAKRGSVGISYMVRAESSVKSTQLQDHEGQGKIDILSTGKMTVLPPTLHKDTAEPYQWIGKPLLECAYSELPRFTHRQLSLLKRIVGLAATPTIFGGSTTHDAALAFCGSLVQFGCNDVEIRNIVQSLLPAGYSGNTLEELDSHIEGARRKGFDRDDLPVDERIAQVVEEEWRPVIYLPSSGLLRYRDGHWQTVRDSLVEKQIKDCLLLHGGKALVAPRIMGVKKCLSLNVERENFGSYSPLICLKNGTLDVETGALLPWSPDHQLLYQLDLEYDPAALCPTYDSHVRSTLCDDEQAVATFEEFAGLTLVPDTSFQRALYLLGEAGSGKSTLLKLVETMHSPYAITTTPLDQIENERYRTELAPKLLCISPDVQSDRKVFGDTFMRITGGDAIAIRKLYFEVEGRVLPTTRFMGSMNRKKLPPPAGSPDALERRLIILPCGGKIEKPDRGYATDLNVKIIIPSHVRPLIIINSLPLS